jgi:very-short-patch-repair endonuclease
VEIRGRPQPGGGHHARMHPRVPLPPSLAVSPFSYREGIAAGLGHGRLRGRDLQRPFFGTRHPGGGRLSLEQRCRALQRRIPDHAFFCGITAAALLGLPLPYRLSGETDLHVGAPAPARALSAEGIVGHKLGIRTAEIESRSGLRITTPARTRCDLAVVLALPELVSAGDFLLRRSDPLATRSQIAECVRHHPGRRGRPALRLALDLLDDRSESPAESALRVILLQGGFTGMVPNHIVRDRRGRFVARVDLAFPAARVAVEYEGDYHRTEAGRWRKDMIRIRRLEAAGWRVLRVNADDLRDPTHLLILLARVLALRSTPEVHD